MLWKTEQVEFLCCICYGQETRPSLEGLRENIISTPRTRAGESDMFDALRHAIISGPGYIVRVRVEGDIRPGDLVIDGSPYRHDALDALIHGSDLFIGASVTRFGETNPKKSRLQRIKEIFGKTKKRLGKSFFKKLKKRLKR